MRTRTPRGGVGHVAALVGLVSCIGWSVGGVDGRGWWGDETSTSLTCNKGDDVEHGLGSRGTSWRRCRDRRTSLPVTASTADRSAGVDGTVGTSIHEAPWRRRRERHVAPPSLPPRRPRPG